MSIRKLEDEIFNLQQQIYDKKKQIEDLKLEEFSAFKGKIIYMVDDEWHGIMNVKDTTRDYLLGGSGIYWEDDKQTIEFSNNVFWDVSGNVKIISKEEALEIIANLYLPLFNNN